MLDKQDVLENEGEGTDDFFEQPMGQKRRSLTDDAKKKFTQDITSSINSSDLSTKPNSKTGKDHNSMEAAEDLIQKKDEEFTEKIDPSANKSSPS